MRSSFRQEAAAALARAQQELESQEPERLKYAALELRMAMEALTYDRAQAFKAEIPPTEYKTWQPRKLLQVLLEIDPTADKDSTIQIRQEDSKGIPTSNVSFSGFEKVLSLATLKKHYDALGSFLHLPSLKQSEEPSTERTFDKLRARCNLIATEIQAALSSPVHNITIGHFSTLPCGRCSEPIRRRMPLDAESVQVQCFNCGAPYEIVKADEPGKVEWVQLIKIYKCSCSESFALWRDQVRPGAVVNCHGCGKSYTMLLGLRPDNVALEAPSDASPIAE
jgi:hypothetical protein